MTQNRQHVPQRTCIACRQIKPKRDMVRLVRTHEGTTELDERGNKPGRGAYLCKATECWELALAEGKKDRLAHRLKTVITPENRILLLEYGEI